MKPFLGIDLTTNKKNEQINGEEFVVARPDLSLTRSLESSSENVEETIKKSKLPLPIRIGHWICGGVGVIVVVSIINALGENGDLTLDKAYQNARGFFGSAALAWWLGRCLKL